MTIRLWKGYHGAELKTLIARSWDECTLLILCPPLLKDFTFLGALSEGPVELYGAWDEAERAELKAVAGTERAARKATAHAACEATAHAACEATAHAACEAIAQATREAVAAAAPVHEAIDASAFATELPVLGVFTSGTLSHSPRLVLYTRRGVVASLAGIFCLFERAEIHHVFCYPQAFHTFGLTLGYLASHIMGWELHTPEGKYQRASHAQRLALREEKVLTLGTPTHFFDLLSMARESGEKLRPSYSCIMGGASVSRELWRRVQSELNIAAPSIGYGCTEAAPGISHLPPGLEPEQDGEIGFPLASLQSRLVAEKGVEISGESLCLAVIQNGVVEFPKVLVIRDRVEVSPSGSWLYQGRLDLLMNRGGAKYSLEFIEKTLHERLGIQSVACGLKDARLGQDLAMAFVHDLGNSPEQILSRERIYSHARTLIQEVFALELRPEKTRFVTDLPLNEFSKLDRKSIWTLFEQECTIGP